MAELKLYPVGIQTFERIIEENKLYVDKTDKLLFYEKIYGKGGRYLLIF